MDAQSCSIMHGLACVNVARGRPIAREVPASSFGQMDSGESLKRASRSATARCLESISMSREAALLSPLRLSLLFFCVKSYQVQSASMLVCYRALLPSVRCSSVLFQLPDSSSAIAVA